tara:strand:+ start:613 stop:1098 length:486 start_codon:yes stop_codon:yes gene_type:complete
MKNYRVTIDGRVYEVEIDDPRARPVTARLSGTAYSVDIESGQVAPVESDVKSSPPTLPEQKTTPNEFETESPAQETPNATNDSSPNSAQATAQGMTAPIPGVVSKVSVLPGQKVERGDELLTIEAMKMFNVMRSPSGGTIATVHVKQGDRVVQGQPLVTFA